jgi:hypothetical protein
MKNPRCVHLPTLGPGSYTQLISRFSLNARNARLATERPVRSWNVHRLSLFTVLAHISAYSSDPVAAVSQRQVQSCSNLHPIGLAYYVLKYILSLNSISMVVVANYETTAIDTTLGDVETTVG